ncbi:MAG: polysaccharide biosynthesis protein [Deltaproteobacteria bacterium]|nr:MAG: polysaccharide biosynthesis protein [Deltaproteobacteria bacterium]
MKSKFSNPNFYLIFGADMVLFILAHLLSYCIRFECELTAANLRQMTSVLLFMVPFKSVIFMGASAYRGMWRYTGMNDLWRLFKATAFSSLGIITIILLVQRFSGFSRSVFILDAGLTLLFTGGLRFGVRMYYLRHSSGRGMLHINRNRKKEPVFIIGAGDTGERALREIIDKPDLPYHVVGFIDNDPKKKGQAIHNVPVLGNVESLRQNTEAYGVEEALIAVPSASGAEMRKMVEACESCQLRFKTLPSLSELIDGKVSIKALRDVNYKDLLRRPPVELNVKQIQTYLTGKTVLVTGAGGSIGSELCRQIVRFNPDRLILMDASEFNLYNIQMEFRHRIGYLNCVTVLGDVRDEALMEQVFGNYKPQVVFHAAAYKHVPMLERNPWQAVLNNIRGTQVLMEQSVQNGVKHFVLISTDKAVRPTNIMGASKRICELLLQSFRGNGTHMMAVRFGNVLASSGSVIPLFQEQIARGGPVTVTHPEITRYFMTIPEATQLVLQAGALGKGGEVFILKMGTAVKIADMARDLIRFMGKEPDQDIQIVFTGLRQGEKLYEELIAEGEDVVSTDHKNILVLEPHLCWNGMSHRETFYKWLMQGVKELCQSAEQQDACGIKKKFRELIPEYDPRDTECVL